jgi:hypothetical protein
MSLMGRASDQVQEMLPTIKRMCQDVTTVPELHASLRTLAVHLLSAERAHIYFVDPSRKDLYRLIRPDEHKASKKGKKKKKKEAPPTSRIVTKHVKPKKKKKKKREPSAFPLNRGIVGLCVQTGSGLRVDDAAHDPRVDASLNTDRKGHTRPTQSMLCQCVLVEENVMAVVQVINKVGPDGDVGTFSQLDAMLLKVYCHQLSTVLQHNFSSVILDRTGDNDSNTKLIQLLKDHGYKYDAPMPETHQHTGFHITLPTVAGESGGVHLVQLTQQPTFALQIPMEEVRSYEFNALDYSTDELTQIAFMILHDVSAFTSPDYELNEIRLTNFLQQVVSSYRDNPYHNFYHGFSVFHYAYLFLCFSGLRNSQNGQASETEQPDSVVKFDGLATLSTLIAALCHDIDHPGNTNGFEIAIESMLAQRYNDRAVLENPHAAVTMQLIQTPQFAFIEVPAVHDNKTKTRKPLTTLRKYIIGGILATDMAQHLSHQNKLEALEEGLESFIGITPESETKYQETCELLIGTVVHASDLSGQVLPLAIAEPWEELVNMEFIAQSQREEELGLEVSPGLLDLERMTARSQKHLNFIDTLLKPFWTQVVRQFPGLQDSLTNLQQNREFYTARRDGRADEWKENNGVLPVPTAATAAVAVEQEQLTF